MSHAHLHNGLPFHSLQAQIFLSETLKMWMTLVREAQRGSGHKALFPHVGPGHGQQLYLFIFMWWEVNLTQRFLTHPYQRDAGMVWE